MNTTLTSVLDEIWKGWRDLSRWVDFWIPDVDLPLGLSPFAALGAFMALIATTGVAVGAFATLLASVLTLYLLLTQVFGLRFELALR